MGAASMPGADRRADGKENLNEILETNVGSKKNLL